MTAPLSTLGQSQHILVGAERCLYCADPLYIKGARCAVRRPGGELPLVVAAVGAGVGWLSGVGLLPAQGALSTAP